MTPGDVFRFISNGRERGIEGVVAHCGPAGALLCVRGRWNEELGNFEPETGAPRAFYACDSKENLLLLGHIARKEAERMEQEARQPLRKVVASGGVSA